MKVTLNRHPTGLTCTIGEILVNGEPFCHCLEDPVRELAGAPIERWKVKGDTAIPAGTYALELTVSERARQGHLWTPSAEFRLPQILDVPGFEGVRMHAGNTNADTEGCPLLGTWNGGEFIHGSRPTLQRFMDLLEIERIVGRASSIEICNAA